MRAERAEDSEVWVASSSRGVSLAESSMAWARVQCTVVLAFRGSGVWYRAYGCTLLVTW